MKPKLLHDTGRRGDKTTLETPCIIQGNFKIHVEHSSNLIVGKRNYSNCGITRYRYDGRDGRLQN